MNVNRSSYYYYLSHKDLNKYEKANKELDAMILEEYYSSDKRYGSPKIAKILNKKGVIVSEKRVAKRMKVLGIKSIVVKKFNHNGKKSSKDEVKERE